MRFFKSLILSSLIFLLSSCGGLQFEDFQKQPIYKRVVGTYDTRCVYNEFYIESVRTQPDLNFYAPLSWTGNYNDKEDTGLIVGNMSQRGYVITITVTKTTQTTIVDARAIDIPVINYEKIVDKIFSGINLDKCKR